jgi:hypothetical protein
MNRRRNVPSSIVDAVEVSRTKAYAPSQPPSSPAIANDRRATAITPANGSHWSARGLQKYSRS